MELTTEMLARQREATVRRTVSHSRPTVGSQHPLRRRTARSLRRLASALDADR